MKAQESLDFLGRIAGTLEELAARPVQRNDCSTVTDYIDLPDDAPHVTRERRIQWNKDDGTLDVGLYNGVVLQCGQELHVYAKNSDAATIANGAAVMVTGAVGASGKLTVGVAVADGSVNERYMLGVATQDIAPGAFGYITTFGLVRGFDTTGSGKTVPEVWSDGDMLFFDPVFPGELTITEPDAPDLRIPCAIVINAGAGGSGSMDVRMKTGDRLTDLHDVLNIPIFDLALLQYNLAQSRWEPGTLTWCDIDFPIVIRTAGVGIPTLVAIYSGIVMPQWQVNDYNVCEAQELVHGWKEGSEVFWHIHLTTNGLDATNRYVAFELQYGYVAPNGTWTFTTITTADLLISANTADKTMLILPLGSFTPPVPIASHVVARLKRVASVGAAPTGNPWIEMLQLHIQTDTVGSRNMTTK